MHQAFLGGFLNFNSNSLSLKNSNPLAEEILKFDKQETYTTLYNKEDELEDKISRIIKDIYGAEADPAINEKLQKECQKIADTYWKGASIEVFDAKSPEYGLSITRMKS